MRALSIPGVQEGESLHNFELAFSTTGLTATNSLVAMTLEGDLHLLVVGRHLTRIEEPADCLPASDEIIG
jgi:hypothetical protein